MQPLQTNRVTDSRKVAILADPHQEVGLLIKDILKSLKIRVHYISPDLNDIIQRVENFEYDMVVIDDVPHRPGPLVLRELLRHPITSLVPIIMLLNETNKAETHILSSVCRPMIINKPMSPGRFANGYESLIKLWNSQNFMEINAAVDAFHHGRPDEGIQKLTTLARNPKSQAIVAPSIASILRKNDNVAVAEKVLLSALKTSSRDAGVILSLCELYMSASMPFTAQRLLKSYEAHYGKPFVTVLDWLQAHLMLQELDPAILLAKELLKRDAASPYYKSILAKLLYAEGRVQEFTQFVGTEGEATRFANAWNPPAAPQKQAG